MLGKILNQFSLDTGISQKEVAQKLGYSTQRVNNYFTDKAEPPFEFYESFHREFKYDLKAALPKDGRAVVERSITAYNPIPVYDLELKAIPGPEFLTQPELIAYHIDTPMFNDCTAAVKIIGAAMSPLYNPGEIAIVKKVTNFGTLPLGEPFVIVTDEQILFRYLRANDKKEGTYILRAEDKKLDDIVIDTSDIRHLLQIKGKIARR